MYTFVLFFFFSSRRRHTRCLSDWSSDVCSSDLRAATRRQSCGTIMCSSRRPLVIAAHLFASIEKGGRLSGSREWLSLKKNSPMKLIHKVLLHRLRTASV